MKIYNIEYTTEQKVERRMIDDTGMDVEFKMDDEDEFENVTLYMQIGGDNFYGATFEATEMLNEVYGENEYEILGIQEIQGVDIMNWPGEGEPCSCPLCKAKTMSDEDVMIFSCPACNKSIRVSHGDWEGINCPECGELILQDNILDLGKNQYKAIKIEEKKG